MKEYSDILTKNLPASDKEQLIAVSKQPGFLIGWLGEWMKKVQDNGETFLNDFPEEITPISHDITFVE